jgi:hypothetical protein
VSYHWYLDGVDKGLLSPGAGYDVPVESLSDGSLHSLTARGRDAAGTESTNLSVAKDFTVDRSTGLTGVTTPPAFTKTAPSIAFSPPGDAAGVVCRTKFGGSEVGSTSGCSSPYSPQGITTDGQQHGDRHEELHARSRRPEPDRHRARERRRDRRAVHAVGVG